MIQNPKTKIQPCATPNEALSLRSDASSVSLAFMQNKVRTLAMLLVAACALLLPSCMIVPPFTSPVSPKVEGQVIDSVNSKPISGAIVRTERAGYVREARTSDNGIFEVPSASQWHYLVYLGSPGFYPTPWVFTAEDRDLHLTVEAEGYAGIHQTFQADDGLGWEANVPSHLVLQANPDKNKKHHKPALENP